MAVRFEEYRTDHIEAVRRFNARIASGIEDAGLIFPLHPLDTWLPKGGDPDIFQDTYLGVDETGEVRGGYVLKHQPFAMRGEIRRASMYRLALSEGIVDRRYVTVGLLALRHALAQQPYLFSLGMGSFENSLAKMQKAGGWSQYGVPFHFRVVKGAGFLRNIAPLRSTAARRAVADIAALTGAGSLAFAALRMVKPARVPRDVSVEPVPSFGPWTDELWERCRDQYKLIAVRDRRTSDMLYPPTDGRFLRWKITAAGRVAGWVVCLNTRMHASKQFGNMQLATIVDCLAEPKDAGIVIAAVTRELEKLGPNLIICNQMHAAWSQALKEAGFFSGPTNFIFSVSKKLAEPLSPWDQHVSEGHINRGDGDGPVHL